MGAGILPDFDNMKGNALIRFSDECPAAGTAWAGQRADPGKIHTGIAFLRIVHIFLFVITQPEGLPR